MAYFTRDSCVRFSSNLPFTARSIGDCNCLQAIAGYLRNPAAQPFATWVMLGLALTAIPSLDAETAMMSTLNETACGLATRSVLADGAALADCVLPASLSGRNSDEATVARWLKLGDRAVDFNSLAPSARIQQPFVDQWHIVTQNILFRHLRQLWADDRPRTMVDLGCHAV
jgi:hypothetical protein